ncbi:hypothetical protein OSH11_24160 [Kaistia dalseonensis]|uniref:Uncharacterized protein n=1 Tax=Kaistia dalseonensis TaxID=410840 RepID=A0ABU0HG29_9HYPH|nr:hypothetical protein [Kaistia dalseonensis]MCX5497815.1 hypothetical protein [Kaistia dalseonensis]MDQ0440459.1 hypothetical protein [Kaistia dalseonensis]
MAKFNIKTAASVIGTAALVAFGVTAYGTAAIGGGNGTKDPTAVISFDKATVGGRTGCEIQSWPYIAPECLTPSSGTAKAAKAARRV